MKASLHNIKLLLADSIKHLRLGTEVLEQDEEFIYVMLRKENVKRVYYGAVALLLSLLLLLPFQRWLHCFELSGQQLGIMLIINAAFAVFVTLHAKTLLLHKEVRWFQPFYLCYFLWTTGNYLYLALHTNTGMVVLVIMWEMQLVFSHLFLLSPKERILYLAEQGLFFAILFQRGCISSEQLFYLLSLTVFSVLLMKEKYEDFVKCKKNHKDLTDAINLAETDPMTKLLNRRGLQRSICSIWPYCTRHKLPVAVIMLDIDNFKKYNDAFGHLQGDECIKMVAGEIRKATRRKTDLAARVGGEEFLMFLTGVHEEDAIRWARNLQNHIEALEIPHAKQNFLPIVTVSMGISCGSPYLNEEFSVLRNEADEELYKAKESGRACIVFQGKIFGKKKHSEYTRKLHHMKRGEKYG